MERTAHTSRRGLAAFAALRIAAGVVAAVLIAALLPMLG